MTTSPTPPEDPTLGIYRYRLFGAILQSGIPLPDLPAAPVACVDTPRFELTLGPVPPHLPDPFYQDVVRQVNQDNFLQILPGLGRVLVSKGRRIILDSEPGQVLGLTGLLRLGCLPYLSLIMGLLPLHASGVSRNSGAALFTGRSGQGKSSLAAALLDAGFDLVADDVCHIGVQAEMPMVWPLLREIRLWRDAARGLGWDGRESERLFDKLDKYRFTDLSLGETLIPVQAVYHLEGDIEGDETRIERIHGLEAVKILLRNTFSGRSMVGAEPEAELIRRCAGIVLKVPVYRFIYPKRFNALGGVIDALRHHWESHA